MLRRSVLCLTLLGLITSLAAAQDDAVLGKKREEWLKILKEHKEVKFRRAAVIALNVIGVTRTAVLPGLLDAMENDAEPDVRREIVLLIGSLDSTDIKGVDVRGAVDALAVRLEKDKDHKVRQASARSLGKLAQHAAIHVSALGRALKDADPETRATAAEALKAFGDKAKLVTPQLLEAAVDVKNDRFTRVYAIEMLSKYADDEKTVKLLVQILEDEKSPETLRLSAAKGIATMGPVAAGAIPQITKIALDTREELDLRRAATVALGKMGDRTASWDTVKTLLASNDTGLRYQAVRMAGGLGKGNKEAATAMVDMLTKEQNAEVLLATIQEVAEVGATSAIEPLTKIVTTDTRLSIREAAAASLKKIKGS